MNTSSFQPGTQPQSVNDDAVNQPETTGPLHNTSDIVANSSQPGTQPQSVNDDAANQSETTGPLHNTSDIVALMRLDSVEKTLPLMAQNESDSTDMIISERDKFEDLGVNRSFNCSTNVDTGERDNDFNQLDVRLSDTMIDSDDIDEVNVISAKNLDTHNESELNQSESELNQSNNYSIDCDETDLRHSAELIETQSLKSSKGETNQNAEKMRKKKYTEQEKMDRLQQVLTAVPERGMHPFICHIVSIGTDKKRILGECLLISSLPGLALRTLVDIGGLAERFNMHSQSRAW